MGFVGGFCYKTEDRVAVHLRETLPPGVHQWTQNHYGLLTTWRLGWQPLDKTENFALMKDEHSKPIRFSH